MNNEGVDTILTKEEKNILKNMTNEKQRSKVEDNFILMHKICDTFVEFGIPSDLSTYAIQARKDISRIDEVNSKYRHYRKALYDCVDRAKDIWDLSYGDGDGLYPAGNQIGRRNVMPEDVGRKTWKHRTDSDHKYDKAFFIDCILDQDVFLLMSGIAYKPIEGDSLKGISHPVSGVTLPFQPMSKKWTLIDDYYVYLFDECFILSPKTQLEMNLYENQPGLEYEIELLGDIIGKREYIIRPPSQLNIQSAIRHDTI